MASNFFESIATMPGPLFLLLCGCVIALTLALCRWLVRRPDWTSELPPLQIPSDPDPYEIAYLRGGANELSRLLIFSLMERGYLSLVDPKKHQIQWARERLDSAGLSPIELTMLRLFSEPRETREVFHGISDRMEPHCATYRERLEADDLLDWRDERQGRVRGVRLAGAAVIVCLGTYKLLAASATSHNNVGFLIIMMAMSLVVLMQVTKSPRLSSRGQDYVERLRLAYGTRPPESAMMSRSGAESAALLFVGLFGLGALEGITHDIYAELFPKANSGSSLSAGSEGCGAGCGGGCGGCGGCGD
jgi:uncharacterized protein (TIGR04222 family)